MNKILLLLGSPNDEKGELSQIALDRINYAYDIYKSNGDIKLLCTGGFGEHFNTTNLPHAHYAQKALLEKGALQKDFLPFVLSSNTYEDFEIAKQTIEKNAPDLLVVVTSDFHIERAILLHKMLIDYPWTIFLPAKSSLCESALLSLIRHEEQAIKRLNNNSSMNSIP